MLPLETRRDPPGETGMRPRYPCCPWRGKDYYEIFDNSNVFENLVYNLDEISSTYAYDFEKNYAKWKTLGTQQHVYSTSDVLNFKTQMDAKNFFKNWLTNRNEYLKSIWGKGE